MKRAFCAWKKKMCAPAWIRRVRVRNWRQFRDILGRVIWGWGFHKKTYKKNPKTPRTSAIKKVYKSQCGRGSSSSKTGNGGWKTGENIRNFSGGLATWVSAGINGIQWKKYTSEPTFLRLINRGIVVANCRSLLLLPLPSFLMTPPPPKDDHLGPWPFRGVVIYQRGRNKMV